LGLFTLKVNAARIAATIFNFAKLIAALGHLAVNPLPEGQRAGDVEQGR
jgi:hypothetical protein